MKRIYYQPKFTCEYCCNKIWELFKFSCEITPRKVLQSESFSDGNKNLSQTLVLTVRFGWILYYLPQRALCDKKLFLFFYPYFDPTWHWFKRKCCKIFHLLLKKKLGWSRAWRGRRGCDCHLFPRGWVVTQPLFIHQANSCSTIVL